MSLWLVLGFGWLMVMLLLAIFSMQKGFFQFVVWLLFGGALMAFHLTMHDSRFFIPPNLSVMMWVIKAFSTIFLLWAGSYVIKRSFNPE